MQNKTTGGVDPWASSAIQDLITEIESVRSAVLEQEAALDLSQFGDHLQSARNLAHYLALRRFDLRSAQERLAALGISSLGGSEGHVLYDLDVVLEILYRLIGLTPPVRAVGGVTPSEGKLILEQNAARLLGPRRKGRSVRTMVTMPKQAATDYGLVRDLLASGMDCMRINCAHDTESDWAGMISNLRHAEKEVGRTCRILMDIAGPKPRTGPLKPGPQVVRIRPIRDALGRVVRPARVWLTPNESREEPAEAADATLPLPREFLIDLAPGTVLRLRDVRGSRRSLRVESRSGDSFWASSGKTAYVTKGMVLSSANKSVRVGDLPHIVQPISLKVGDILVVSGRRIEGRDAVRDASGLVRRPAVISCTLPQALATVTRGQPIWFDDGKIGGIVISASREQVRVRITNAAQGGSRLRSDKGINLPKTELRLPPITKKDTRDLEFVTKHADLVGYSFMRTAEDLDLLRAILSERGRVKMGIVLKIETLRAFEQLPRILLAALHAPPAGVMIARGDLAVECGYERLSEMQEEILWFCEAAHMPCIWATQVLERMAKNGIPSRAEVTDAAMGERAECVMLDKGPFMVKAVKALDGILERMQAHQAKRSALLRHLNIAESFIDGSVRGRHDNAGHKPPSRVSHQKPSASS
jgi:pyruvate kinase